MRRRTVGMCMLAMLVVASGCRRADTSPGLTIIDLGRDAATGIANIDAARRDVAPAAALRLTVEQLLAAHGVSATAMMRSVAADGTDVTQRLDALAKNTADLTGAIGLVYGPTGARAFDQLWSQHTQAFLDYASARSDGARAEARAHLEDYEHDFASFVATATAGGVPASAVEDMLRQHNAQMLGQLDAVAENDTAGATNLAVASIEYLSSIGFALSSGFATQQPAAFPGPIDNENIAYCSLLGRQVATSAVRASIDRAAAGDDGAQQAALDSVAAGYAAALAQLK